MKSTFILFISFFLLNNGLKAHDRIVFKTKESFNQSCQTGKFCSEFDMLNIDNKADLKAAFDFVKQNTHVFKGTSNGTLVNLEVVISIPDKAIYEKLFHVMNLQEIEILEGDAKGIYSVEEFLSLYKF